MYEAQQAEAGAEAGTAEGAAAEAAAGTSDEDVVEADYEVVDESKSES